MSASREVDRLCEDAGSGRTQTILVCGGDGIMCSNERIQIIGIGQADKVDRLEIAWPSGESTVAVALPANSTAVAIEGHSTVIAQ